MASNIYTKNEILQNLASRGYFVDVYTLDTFLNKWKIESIFEDEQGSEFYDKKAYDFILSNLFNAQANETPAQEQPTATSNEQKTTPEIKEVQQNTVQKVTPVEIEPPKVNPTEEFKQNLKNEDSATYNVLNNISLSDGTPLLDKVQNNDIQADNIDIQLNNISDEMLLNQDIPNINISESEVIKPTEEAPKRGLLDGAMEGLPTENLPPQIDNFMEDSDNIDDLSLLSESLEAQEKFRQYVVSELSKKNVDLSPNSQSMSFGQNEFKLDISERTLSMIAKTMAKKIAKHVSMICSQDAKSSARLAEVEEINKKLEQKAKELEEQNKKLRLLLVESNKNLNSYKPSIFGLYKKVSPDK